MTSFDRSIVAGTVCVPSNDTRPPLVTASKPWCRAAEEPDISSRMSTPLPSVSARSRPTTSSRASSARSAPIRVAIASRSGLMSVAKTARAPAFLSTAMLIRPIGPQPVTTAVWPATSSTKALKTALPSGSWSAAISNE